MTNRTVKRIGTLAVPVLAANIIFGCAPAKMSMVNLQETEKIMKVERDESTTPDDVRRYRQRSRRIPKEESPNLRGTGERAK